MTDCYLSSGNWKRFFVYAILVGTYGGWFRTSATSKIEHFVTKKLAKAFPKKTFKKYAKKKINIETDKYPQTNTVKILHESFFFQNETCYVNHALFSIHTSFFQTFIDGYWLCRLHTQLAVSTGWCLTVTIGHMY